MGRKPQQEQFREFEEEGESLWHIALAPLIWVAHFVICYGATALVCAKLPDSPDAFLALRTGIGGLTFLALAGILRVGWRAWRQWDFLEDYDHVHDLAVEEHRHEFLGHASFLLALISFVAVIYVALPTVFIKACG